MRTKRQQNALPIGRTARIAVEIDGLRGACSKAARAILRHKNVDEAELEECARLDEALARAHRLLKGTIRQVMLTRLSRRSRAR